MSFTNEMSKTAEPTVTPLPPVELSVAVPLAPDAAFRLFTAEMSSWWPLATHSVGRESAREVRFEPSVGGRVFEIDADGAEHDWARVLAWEPGRRLVLSWFPGRDAATGQEVEVRFEPDGEGTRVELEHRDWERLAERAVEAREGYAGGWTHVLGERFRDRAIAVAG